MKKIINSELEENIILNNKFQNNERGGKPIKDDFLQQKEIHNFHFLNANLSSLYMIKNLFKRCNMTNTDLSGGALNESMIIDCKFSNCSFRKTELQLIEFENCEFENCDFSRAQILNSEIKNTKFINCNFRGIHICNSYIESTTLSIWTEEMVIFSNNKEVNVIRI